MDIETSSEPELKQRRVEEPATTPERLKALIDAGDITSLGALLRQAPELLDAECIQPSSNHAATPPLCYAASKGFEPVVRFLVESNAVLNTGSWRDLMPIAHACSNGHLSVAKFLRAHEVNSNFQGAVGKACLMMAVFNAHETVLTWLLAQGVNANTQVMHGCTPLMMACMKGHLGVAQVPFKMGANLAARDSSGSGCLLHATINGHEKIVAWLLSLGQMAVVMSTNGIIKGPHRSCWPALQAI